MGVKISDLTAASNVADANEFEINESGTSKKVTASQIKSYATNSTSVTAAGALMDSELADVSAVKGINQALTTTSAPTFNGVTTTGDISFPDNVKAKFGNSDLQIYHDGTHSRVNNSTGDLFLQSPTVVRITNSTASETAAKFFENGAVELYHDNSSKLTTSSNGISVSGSATLDSDGTLLDFSRVGNAVAGQLKYVDADTAFHFGTTTNHDWYGISNDTKRLKVDNGGDISFYDTSGNAKFFWDASAERLGLGTAAPVAKIDIVHTGNTRMLFSEEATNTSTISTVNTANSAYSDLNVYANNLKLSTNGSERLRLTSSGSVGIGISSPSKKLDVDTTMRVTNAAGSSAAELDVSSGSTWRLRSNPTSGTNSYGLDFIKGSAGTDVKMSIDNSGNVGIGCIPTYKFEVDSGGIVAAARLRRTTDATLRTVLLFLSSSNSNTVGSVSINNTSTSYNTSSDYRLKENVVDLTGATDRLKQLEPKRFNFIADADTTVDGFLAHEVQSVVPEAITGTHNEVDDDGNAVMQGIDQGKLVPLLTAALQEAIDKIEILETKVAALEGA